MPEHLDSVGVGILTYNRPNSLRRLIDSIATYRSNSATIFVSDDGSTDPAQLAYLDELQSCGNIVVLGRQLGIAGNSNRLLHCLSPFRKKILLNDDVEILALGWEQFYFSAMQRTNFHHFCHRQPGVYGAARGDRVMVNGIALNVVLSKPHGAVMALDDVAFAKVGYFDEQFGQYGMEHVDWSTRLSSSGLQPSGFFDVEGSDAYFLVHAEQSAVENRVGKFRRAKLLFNALGARPTYINETKTE